MDPAALAEFVERSGHVVSRRALLKHIPVSRLRHALTSGELVRLTRGSYAIPEVDTTLRRAGEMNATVILLSAAQHWGWPIKTARSPQLAVPLGRKVNPAARRGVDLRWRAIPPGDRSDLVTTPLRTVLDCCSLLPFDEALCVADSGLRSGRITREDLMDALTTVPRLHRRRVERVIRYADPRAANPFESCLRAVCMDIPGLQVEPQFSISDGAGFVGRVDLADERLRLVLEAESYEFHSGKDEFERDCLRYSRLAVADWLVLRFPWAPVMHRQHEVRSLIAAGVELCEVRMAAGARLNPQARTSGRQARA